MYIDNTVFCTLSEYSRKFSEKTLKTLEDYDFLKEKQGKIQDATIKLRLINVGINNCDF